MKRRDFFKTSLLGVSTLGLVACNESGRKAIDESKRSIIPHDEKKTFNINKNKKTTIKLATSWPAHFPIMGTGVDEFAKMCFEASGGSLNIKIFAKNTLVPALAVFDATSSGQIDAFHSGPYYWKGKNSAFSLFSGSPFGFTAEEINSWMIYGGGLELWRKLYSKYNLYPFLGGNTNIQMGGWFRKPIESLKDMQGLKMRIPGLGGEVFTRLGVNTVLLPAGEIYTSLERGVIDATEWVGPYLDLKMGFYKVAPNYYSGFHEPGSVLELTFNKKVYENLANEHKAIIELASSSMNANMTYNFHSKNIEAMKQMEPLGITIRNYPDDVIKQAKIALVETIDDLSKKNPSFKEVQEHASQYLKDSKKYSDISLRNFLNIR